MPSIWGLLLFWIIFSFLCGKYAKGRGLSDSKFFWISMITSPLIGFIWCYITPEDIEKIEYTKVATKQNKRCPYCDELIKVKAIKCKYCGSDLIGGEFQEGILLDKEGTEICPKCKEPRVGKFIKKCLKCGKMFND